MTNLLFQLFSFSAFQRFLRYKRVCAWCTPPRYIGGNPFATRITHGICPACAANMGMKLAPSKALIRIVTTAWITTTALLVMLGLRAIHLSDQLKQQHHIQLHPKTFDKYLHEK